MFTGIVKEIGTIVSMQKNQEGYVLGVRSTTLINDIFIDDSVAVEGACQTVIKKEKEVFYIQSVQTTLDKTTFSDFKVGRQVNLELALQLSDRLGGHFVQGHVNGTGRLAYSKTFGANYILGIKIGDELIKYIIKEGSVALNGVSLTVSNLFLDKNIIEVSIIPHTFNNTTFKDLTSGAGINIEVDIFAKYIENFLLQQKGTKRSEMTIDWIKAKGF